MFDNNAITLNKILVLQEARARLVHAREWDALDVIDEMIIDLQCVHRHTYGYIVGDPTKCSCGVINVN